MALKVETDENLEEVTIWVRRYESLKAYRKLPFILNDFLDNMH
jgi:hypothetical protein